MDDQFWTFLTHFHSFCGPILMLVYPLYASVMAMESRSTLDDEQWLAYWIIYSFLSLAEMILQSALEWFPIYYIAKLVFVGWLVLPQFKGAAYIYKRFVRANLRKHKFIKNDHHHHLDSHHSSHNGKSKNKFVQFMTHNKGEYQEY
ncbi:HVA22-like protein e [Mercurialis annua]|uniref:HVA22-like protein e n=1 Tax=Mercurialis annua TaxID=3986 RepID=UPI002160E33C|nr:HVA22-like protein e [Mercurialis annua]